MRLSILIPAYNEEVYIGACLASIVAEVERTQRDVEIIVVNNASTDKTGDITRAFPRVRVIDEPKKGLVQARQTGFLACSGDLIGNVDADTRMPQGWMQTVFGAFESDPSLVAITGPCYYYDLSKWVNMLVWIFYGIGLVSGAVYSFLIGKKMPMMQGGNAVIRRTALERAGGFDLNFQFYGEDVATAKRVGQFGPIKFTSRLTMPTSARRLKKEGILTMAWKYAINLVWTTLLGRAYSREYRDIR